VEQEATLGTDVLNHLKHHGIDAVLVRTERGLPGPE
jgi:hypothetical protein